MRAFDTFKKGLGFGLRWVCITLFALLVIVVVFQVAVRSVGSGAAWSEAAARFLFIWLGMIGAAYVIGENDDVAIDFLVRKFSAAVAKAVEIVAHAVVATFAVSVMIYGGGRFVTRTWDQTVELMPFTLGQLYLVLPISGALILLYSISHIIDTVRRPLVPKSEDEIDITTLAEEGI